MGIQPVLDRFNRDGLILCILFGEMHQASKHDKIADN